MCQLREKNANLRAWLTIHHPPLPPTPPYSSSFQTPTHAKTRHQEIHTQISSHNTRKDTPIHSRLRSFNINDEVICLHPSVDGIKDIPFLMTWKPLNFERYDSTSDQKNT